MIGSALLRRGRALLVLAAVAAWSPLVSNPLLAGGRVIPECTPLQVSSLRGILAEYVDAYTGISDRIGPMTLEDFAAHTDEVDELIADMHELQLQWRREGEPQMPDCVLAVDIGAALGRLFDESLIAVLLLDAGYRSFAEWHADPISELADELGRLLKNVQRDSAESLRVWMAEGARPRPAALAVLMRPGPTPNYVIDLLSRSHLPRGA